MSSALSGTTLMALLTSLPLPSSAAEELVSLHAPFVQPSTLSQSQLGKWLARLNSAVMARDPAAASLAAIVIEQDREGYAAAQHGKGWMGSCLGVLAAPATTVEALPSFLKLTCALVAAAPQAPAFEREVVQPAMGKIAVSLSRLVERLVEAQAYPAIRETLEAASALISASPPPFRPAAPALRAAMTTLVLGGEAPEDVKYAAAQTLAVLHMAAGKAGAPAAWGSDMREALGGLAASMSAMTAEAMEEEPPRTAAPPPSSSLPAFPVDHIERVNAALFAVEGYTELAVALLTTATARPVPVPIAQIISAALRALNLTFDTPVAPYVSPSHHAALAASLPRVWAAGLLLLGGAMAACGDHVVPHLTAILEHTVYLLERTPAAMAGARLQLLRFHSLLLQIYPAATLPAEYTQRLLKFSLGVLGGVLDARPTVTSATGTGRKGKKRARGAEDALVGGLAGRAPRPATAVEAEIMQAALELSPALHKTVPPALLNFSLRLHLALYTTIASRPSFTAPSSATAVRATLDSVLEHAATLEAAGTARDIRTLLLSILPSTVERNAVFDALLHPALPPLSRPLPPLAQLHMFAPESEAEKKVRLELGFRDGNEEDEEDEDSDEDEDMAVDDWPTGNGVAQPVAPPTPAPVAVAVTIAPQPVAVEVVVPPPAAVSAPFSAPIPASVPAPASVPVAAPAAVSVPEAAPAAAPFMSSSSFSAPAPPAPAPAPVAAAEDEDDSDEEIPDLDSGSSDEDE
ncbi:hypothetical protein CC85DRAFT_284757 [Cutaneotrichosporon oleaginosum]|uniref:Pre-rRNA-processing protein RIX1 n=1 Tax=Cutaneotrichosporon oleaginosum TaxID=879819 RepID=A0A0J0XQ10_9TREE|nr:uncharacterized protein CC85DRAFT_284757 [Cutaneotrichosporon oleaginosum]KLT43200.1 hypothetical protein CC85DRAFT_284757 [Cutaneotrichosporon oleaginosum]TXT09882.1 hypothetical protein COLE_03816 [Cutaneotrichosporon oleaginosum]